MYQEQLVHGFVEKNAIAGEFYNVLKYSYENCGGLTVDSPLKLARKGDTFWWIVKVDDKIVAGIVIEYHKFGHKIILGGSNRLMIGKVLFKEKVISLLLQEKDYFVEVSPNLEKWLLDSDVPRVFNWNAKTVLYDKEVELTLDGAHYRRMINGQWKEKAMFGKPTIKNN